LVWSDSGLNTQDEHAYNSTTNAVLLEGFLNALYSSAHKDHLYQKNIEANPYCSCKLVETSEHFLLKYSLYERLRNDLFVNLSCHLNIDNLLFGDSNLPDCENESNFLVIQDFIIRTKRFTPRI
jgi:hypothetical protein